MKKTLLHIIAAALLAVATNGCAQKTKSAAITMPSQTYVGIWHTDENPPDELTIFEINENEIKFELSFFRRFGTEGTAKIENNEITVVTDNGCSGTMTFDENGITLTVVQSELPENSVMEAGATVSFTVKFVPEDKKEAEKHPIEIQYEECMEEEDAFTTAGMCDCSAQAEKAWDAEMNRKYRSLMEDETYNKQDKAQLQQIQRKWLEYRDLEFDFMINWYTKEDCGTMHRIVLGLFRMGFVQERALMLDSYFGYRHLIDDICDCNGESEEAWDAELNENYKTLMSEIDSPELQQKLRLAQRKWLEYRVLEFIRVPEDDMGLPCFRACFVKSRALTLKSYSDNFKPQD
jgi:uncharacterized protein YecT (DUF1311 family)